MSEIKQEAITTSGETLAKRVLGGLGRLARDAVQGAPAPAMGRAGVRIDESLSYFDAEAPELPLAEELDRLDALADEELIAAKMSHIEIHKTEA